MTTPPSVTWTETELVTSLSHLMGITSAPTNPSELILAHSTFGDKDVSPSLAGPAEAVTYTIRLRNPGPALFGVRVTGTLRSSVQYLDNLSSSSGIAGDAGGVTTWTETVAAATSVTITIGVTVNEQVTGPQAIVNTALLDDGLGDVQQRVALVFANGRVVFLPLAGRETRT